MVVQGVVYAGCAEDGIGRGIRDGDQSGARGGAKVGRGLVNSARVF